MTRSTNANVLIIEDEEDLSAILAYNLQQEGMRTEVAANGGDGIELARQEPLPDVILLDLMLPDIPGTEVCRKLRSLDLTRHIPIIMVTAKGDEIDRVVGFELGADDYVTKPYSVRELVLRVRAMLRRRQVPDVGGSRTVLGRLRVDAPSHRAWVDDNEISLTTLEFKLLWRLLERRGRVQSRDVLLQDVWGIQAHVTTRTVDTHVMRLRQKLGPAGEYIETLRGAGYRIKATLEGEDG